MSRRLRIFLVCQQDLGGPPHPVPAYRFWRGYFASAFREAGHELLEAPGCDWAAGLLPLPSGTLDAWRGETWQRALDWLRAEHARRPVDLFLSYLYPEQIEPGAIAAIRSLGLPAVNFFCDNVREFRAVPAQFRPFDLHWVPEFKALRLYRHAGLRHLHAPMPCWVPPELRHPPADETGAIAFVGTRDPLRAALFADAITRGLELELWGKGWRESPPPAAPAAHPGRSVMAGQIAFARRHGWRALARKLAGKVFPSPHDDIDFGPRSRSVAGDDDYVAVTRRSLVCLGVNRYPSPRHSASRPDSYSRLRDIEAPMLGACYLTEWTDGLDRLYEPGVEIETYRDASDMVEKARALSADPHRRARLRRAGQKRALSRHSIAQTIAAIAREIGLA